MKLAKTTSPGGVRVSESEILPEVEKGEFVPWNDSREEENGGDLSPLLSLVQFAKGFNLLESIPLFLKPIFPVEVSQKSKLDNRVSNSDYCISEVV